MIADALVNDLVGRLPVSRVDDDPDALRNGVMKTVLSFGTPEEMSVANKTNEMLPR